MCKDYLFSQRTSFWLFTVKEFPDCWGEPPPSHREW